MVPLSRFVKVFVYVVNRAMMWHFLNNVTIYYFY
jgi:hypothetical protein